MESRKENPVKMKAFKRSGSFIMEDEFNKWVIGKDIEILEIKSIIGREYMHCWVFYRELSLNNNIR